MHYRRFISNTLFLLLFAAIPCIAQTESEIAHYRANGIQPLINSTQSGDFAPGTYLIPHDIMIEKGQTVNIFPGTTILFTQNAMLVVNGKLICTGTAEAPVQFKRLDNSLYPEPIDSRLDTRWDGIYLPDSARMKMRNTIISNSKYGIVVSGKDVLMVIDSVRFLNNKFQNIKIGEQVLKISQGTPIRFKHPEQKGVFIPPALVLRATETIQQRGDVPHQTNYPTLRLAMGIAGGAGLIAGIAGYTAFSKYSDDYRASRNRSEKDYRYANYSAIAAGTGACVFVIGAAGFTWTFFY